MVTRPGGPTYSFGFVGLGMLKLSLKWSQISDRIPSI